MNGLILPVLYLALVVLGYMQKELIAVAFQANPYKGSAESVAPVFNDGIMAFRISSGKKTMPAWKQAFTRVEIGDLVRYIRIKSKKAAGNSELIFKNCDLFH